MYIQLCRPRFDRDARLIRLASAIHNQNVTCIDETLFNLFNLSDDKTQLSSSDVAILGRLS